MRFHTVNIPEKRTCLATWRRFFQKSKLLSGDEIDLGGASKDPPPQHQQQWSCSGIAPCNQTPGTVLLWTPSLGTKARPTSICGGCSACWKCGRYGASQQSVFLISVWRNKHDTHGDVERQVEEALHVRDASSSYRISVGKKVWVHAYYVHPRVGAFNLLVCLADVAGGLLLGERRNTRRRTRKIKPV